MPMATGAAKSVRTPLAGQRNPSGLWLQVGAQATRAGPRYGVWAIAEADRPPEYSYTIDEIEKRS